MYASTTGLAVTGLASIALGGNVLLDQIGPDDGSAMGTNTLASQLFEAAFSAYDIAAIDDFVVSDSASVGSVAAVISGWNGYIDFGVVQGARVAIWDNIDAAGASLDGNVCNRNYDPAELELDDNWGGAAPSALVQAGVPAGSCSLSAATYFTALIPVNEFGTNGQTGVMASTLGDGQCWQANPNGGFGFGPYQVVNDNLAYRVLSGTGDPCDDALNADCPADVSGPSGLPDGVVGVDDVLMVIATFGETGDGTSRPQGDCYPLPNGDCLVNVDDVLQVINGYGMICLDLGACCYDNGDCTEGITQEKCIGSGGGWLGDESTCDACTSGACCLGDGGCQNLNGHACMAAGGNYLGDDVACADCPALPANNDCDNAELIDGGTVMIDNTAATTSGETIDPCGVDGPPRQIYQDLYFSITADEDGSLIVDTCNMTTLDTVVAVYDGCGGAVLGCNDDGEDCADFTSYLSVDVSAGQTCIVRIGSYAWGETAVFDATIEMIPDAPGACCVNNTDCYDGLLPDDCDAFLGKFMGPGSECATADCGWAGCQAGDTPEGVPCQEDTDAAGANADPNGGLNVDPPSYGAIAVDETICGSAATFTCLGCGESGEDLNYRDTDWYLFDNMDGGEYTLTCGGQGPLLFGIVDLVNVSFVQYATTLALEDAEFTVTLPAGNNYAVWVGHDFNAGFDTPCGTNQDEYTVRLQGQAAPAAACCVDGDCVGDYVPADCQSFGGEYTAGASCDAGYQCAVPYEGCTGTGEEPLDPADAWTAGSADATYGYLRYASVAASSISSARVWGLTLAYNGGWEVCSDPDMSLAVGAYEDDGAGFPGSPIAEASVAPMQAVVDLTYASIYPLHRFDFDLAAQGNIRWLKAASESDGLGDCWLLWMSSTPSGSGSSVFDNQGTLSIEAFSLSHCLYE